MLQPKQWADLMLQGYVTTDMIDGCVLSAHIHYLKFYRQAKDADRTLERKPWSKATKRRYKTAMLKTNDYLTIREQLLDVLVPVEAVILTRQRHANIGYLVHEIGNHQYLQHKELPVLRRIARKHQLQIDEVDRIDYPSYEIGDLPSPTLINKVVGTIHKNKLSYAIDNGGFDSANVDWIPKHVSSTSYDPDRLVPIGEVKAELMSLLSSMK